MRLYLLPISTRRTLLYAQRLNVTTTESNSGYINKATTLAAKKWADWEKKESGWQRKVVDYGNHALRRIPFEEWGLKSVPPLSARRKDDELRGKEKVQLVFPRAAIPLHKVESVIRTLANEREGLHKKRLIWCVVGMPLTIPVGILPVIPNLPFFYLLYRAWSHWRAISGGRHIQWLIKNRLLQETPSEQLDKLYEDGGHLIEEAEDGKEQMLLTQAQVQRVSDTLEIPALTVELERAIWQVENKLKKEEVQAQEAAKSRVEEVKNDEKRDQ